MKKNICFFNSISFWGGGEKLHLEYALAFKDKGYSVNLFATKNTPLYQKGIKEGISVTPISVSNLSFLNPIKILQLVIIFRKKKIDTVFFSASQDLKIGSIAARIAKVENVIYLRGLAVPIKFKLLNLFILKYLLTHIIANSGETKRMILKNFKKHINHEKVKVIYHGIEISAEEPADIKLPEIQAQGRGVILGNAGRLTKQKGQQHFIQIARKLKEEHVEFTLFIAGTGELKEELEYLIEQNDLKKEVILLGFVEDMQLFMKSIDILVFTSIWEGFGYALVEAMNYSKPIVAFDITSNPEIIDNNKTGYLVAYPDIDAFVQKTLLLINDASLRKKLGIDGNKRFRDHFILRDRIDELEAYVFN